MYIAEIPIGSSVILEIKREDIYHTFRGELFSRKGKGIVLVLPFDNTEQVGEITSNDIVSIRYIEQNKIFYWEVPNVQIIEVDSKGYLYLESSEESENGNRRGAFRVPVIFKTAMKSRDGSIAHVIESMDVSQTGFSFFCGDALQEDEEFLVTLVDCEIIVPLRIQISREYECEGGFVYGSNIIESNQELRKLITEIQLRELRKLRGL